PAAGKPPATTEPQPPAATGGRQGGAAARDTRPRTGLGIMSLADGTVVTVDRVGSFRLPEENATWLAYYKGGGGAAAGGRGGRGRGGAGQGNRRRAASAL
ncbi:MAG: hypothetical protein WD227_12825, partial [Vicinamibacterales bacterium]